MISKDFIKTWLKEVVLEEKFGWKKFGYEVYEFNSYRLSSNSIISYCKTNYQKHIEADVKLWVKVLAVEQMVQLKIEKFLDKK